MVIGLSGVQFKMYSYAWLAKSDDHEAGVWFELDNTLSCYQLIPQK